MSQVPPYPNNQHQQPQQQDVVSSMIPYKNVPALVGYYLGVFSLIPCIGLPLGIAAVIFGIVGLRKASQHPEAKGKAHAIAAIVCGGVFGLVWLVVMMIPVVAAFASRWR